MIIVMKKYSLVFMFLSLALMIWAQGPNNSGIYYKNADGAKGKNLKTALAGIISNHTTISYSGLWDCYKTTDVRPDGKIWDMYSNSTDYVPGGPAQGKSYSKEGDAYNREHSVPQSWFNEQSPMKSDLVHVVPTDGYVNNRRSNYPFGENRGEKYQSNGGFSKLGVCTTPGYSGTVFEPNDEYKGDFARIYFYMVTCYENRVSSWDSDMLDGSSYPAISKWALDMFLRWAADDPVSQKEIDRNNAVYKLQGNRNPFVDYPGLEQYVWGTLMDTAFKYDNFEVVDPGNPDTPDTPDPDNPDKPDPDNPDTPDVPDNPLEGEQTYILVADASQLVIGQDYLIVCDDTSTGLSDLSDNSKFFTCTSVNISGDKINTEVGREGFPHALVLGGQKNAYTFYDAVEEGYLALNSNDNALNLNESDGGSASWTVTISGGKAQITSNAYADRSVMYNKTAPRFACYKSGQTAVSLYINKVSNGIENITADGDINNKVYSLDGRVVANSRQITSLPSGIYIVNGRKIFIK